MVSRLGTITRSFDDGLLASPFAMPDTQVPGFITQHETLAALAPQSLDLVTSLLHLHWEEDLPGTLRVIAQALRPNGVFLGALFGERTLHELRSVLLQAESELLGGAQARIIPFAQIRDLGGLLQGAGFALPVADVERITVQYSSLMALLHDLRGMGQSNPLAGPVRPLRRDVLALAEALYRDQFGNDQGRIVASFEIVHICGWAPHEGQQQPLKPGSAQVSLKEVLGRKT